MVTAIIAIIFIYQLAAGVDWVSHIIGIAEDDYTLKLAVFHSIFNTIGIVVMLPFIGKLVDFLISFMPEKVLPKAAPRYLNASAIELPDTAIEAVRKETVHLYDNAFAIIAHGLNLHRDDILSEKDLNQTALASTKVMTIDVDKEYESTVKGLYGDIIDFISRAQISMEPDQVNELFALRAAGRDIVEAIKDTKHLRKNMNRYITSDNQHIRAEYNKIRVYLASVLRRLSIAKQHGDDPTQILSLDNIKIEMEENDSTVNGMLETLIRESRITAQMATSLMNDAAYAYDVTKNLVQMGEVLFARGDLAMKNAERAIALDESDIAEVIEMSKHTD